MRSIKNRFLSFPTMGAIGMVIVGREISDLACFAVLPNTGKQIYYVSEATARSSALDYSLCRRLRVRQHSLLAVFSTIPDFCSNYPNCLPPPSCPPRRSSLHHPSTSWKIPQAQADGALPSALETRAK